MRRKILEESRWFAWRPVRLEAGGWVWLRTVIKTRWADCPGDYIFEVNRYALLP